MAEDIVSIGIALDTSKVLQGTRQVDAALKSVATASTTTAQATQKMDTASTSAAQALTEESAAAKAAASAMGEHLAKAVAAAAQSMIQAQHEAKKVEDELRRVAQATAEAEKAAALASRTLGQRLSGAFKEVAQQAKAFALAQAGVAGLQAAFTTLTSAVSAAAQAAIKMESLQASFKFVSGSAKAASADLGFLRQTAERLGVSFVESAKGFQQMSAAAQNTKVAGQGVRDVYTAIAEKGRVLGLSSQEIQGAMTAVAQSFSKGTIQAEELRGQFSERMPGAINEMARAMGVGTAALDDMMQKGQLGIEGWIRWAQVVRQDLGGATQDAAQTASAGLARFSNAMEDLKVAVGQYIVPALTATVNLLTGVANAATRAMNALSSYDEVRKKTMVEVGPVASKGDPASLARYADIEQQIADYERHIKRIRTPIMSAEGAFSPGAIFKLGGEEQAKQYEETIKRLRQEQKLLFSDMKTMGDEDKRRAAASAIEQGNLLQKNTFLEGGRKLLESQRKETEAMVAATKAGLGRDPTAEEKVKLQEKHTKATQEFLETNSKLAEQYKDDPVVQGLRERGQAQEAASKALVASKDAATDATKDATAAEQEQVRLDAERRNNVMDTGKRVLEGYEKEGELIGQLHERVRQLTMTEAERLALQVKAIEDPALRAYAEELVKQVDAAQDFNDALRERNKLLVDQAAVSKGNLDDLNRLMTQLEPSRRSMSTEERLAGTRAEIAKRTDDPKWLERADKQIKETLDTELWNKWKDAGLDALDHVGQALEEFVFKGKLNFKDLLGSIAQDVFRMSLQIVQQQVTKKGGWGEMALEWGLKALNVAVAAYGGGGVPSSAIAQPASSASAGSVTSFAGLEAASGMTGPAPAYTFRQHGGPAYAGRPYMVGEVGPELFVPRTSGTVLPHGQGVSSPTVVNVHVSGVTDAQSFVQSRGAVSRAMMGALSQARQQMQEVRISLRYIDGFDHYASGDLTEKWTDNIGMTISAGTGRRGTAALRQSGVTSNYVSLTLDAQNMWTLGFALRYTSLAASLNPCTLAQWLDVDTVQASLRLGLDGRLFVTRGTSIVLATAPTALHANVWYYLEWRLVIHASTGETEIRLDGTTAAAGTGLNTQQSATAAANRFLLGQIASPNATAGVTDRDDVYLCDGQGSGTFTTFLGDCRVDALYPNADGTHTAWTPSAGAAHYALVDEHPPTDDTDYVSATTAGARDSYQLEPLPTMPSPQVLAVQACISARKDDVDEITLAPLLVSGATTSVSSTLHTLTNSYVYALGLWTADPAGGTWTEAAINTLQVGMERSV